MSNESPLNSRHWVKCMLKALVAKHDKEPGEWKNLANPIDAYTVATWAGLIDKKQAEKFRAAQYSIGEYALRRMCLDSVREMEARGQVVLRQQFEGVKDGALVFDTSGRWVLEPTPQGLDAGRRLLQPWYMKIGR